MNANREMRNSDSFMADDSMRALRVVRAALVRLTALSRRDT
jgi:hypothetical protein